MLYLLYMETDNINFNNSYYESLDENFKEAVNLMERDFSHAELIGLLKNGNIPQKQAAALRISTINNAEELQILFDNLTGQDGKIREAVSLKIKELVTSQRLEKYFLDKDFASTNSKTILLAVTDINGNICRNIIDTIKSLKNIEVFCTNFCPLLLGETEQLIQTLEKLDDLDGKYKINKDAFKLYWCLETINIVYDKLLPEELYKIISKAKNIKEYTIREKVAKILSNDIGNNKLTEIRKELKEDENYYVRRF